MHDYILLYPYNQPFLAVRKGKAMQAKPPANSKREALWLSWSRRCSVKEGTKKKNYRMVCKCFWCCHVDGMDWIESTEGVRVEKVWKRNLHAPLTKRMFVSSLHQACYLTDCSFSFAGGWKTCSSYRRRGKLIVTFASIRRPWQDLGMRGWLPNLTVDSCDNRPEKVPDSLSFKHVPMKK